MKTKAAPHMQQPCPPPLRSNGLHDPIVGTYGRHPRGAVPLVDRYSTLAKARARRAALQSAETSMRAPISNANSSETYQGTELARNPGVPASRFAAFDLPSRVGNRLHFPDGRIEEVPQP